MILLLFSSSPGSAPYEKFSKPGRDKAKMKVDGFLYIDIEDFDHYGGWRMDTQYVHLMGSPYLMATGIGKPVEDATTTITIPGKGKYHIWVRARNWVKEYSPGRFLVKINNKALSKEFGAAPTNGWTWEYGGEKDLNKGKNNLALHDITGYYGRCDAILITTDGNYLPPKEKEALCKERARLKGLSLEPSFGGKFDVIVVGGGSAGTPAAIAAARMGKKTALIQNRPVLGGNCSIELGVGLIGSGRHHPGWRETGIIEEAGRIRGQLNQHHYSDAFKQLCDAEENLTVFFNQHVFDAIMKNDKRIKGVKAVSTLTGLITEYHGIQFIDCTGDGWLGYFAKAEYRFGRESRNEFNEDLAPEKADNITMSGCIMGDGLINLTAFRSEETDHPVPFTRPPWAREINTLVSPGRNFKKYDRGLWWMEHGGDINDLWNAEEARDELIKVTFSFWDYVKNKSRFKEEAVNYELITIPIMQAKRETRRLVGDYILTQNDVQSARVFDDRITYAGWPLDIHHPKGIYSGSVGSFDFNPRAPINTIPYRCLYSKNIDNLFFAGRCGSFSHVALGSVRVQSTLATIGQAAGTAAAICVDKNINPRDIYKNHIRKLQQTLLKHDQSIPGLKNEDPDDLARQARVRASSYLSMGNQSIEMGTDNNITFRRSIPLTHIRSAIVPAGDLDRLNSIKIFLESDLDTATKLKVQVTANNNMKKLKRFARLAKHTIEVEAKTKKWYTIPINAKIPKNSKFIRVILPKNRDISWPTMKTYYPSGGRTYQKRNKSKPHIREGEFHALITDPVIKIAEYKPENIINGFKRMKENNSSMWASDPMQKLPQWIELDFDKQVELNTVFLTFDTDLSGAEKFKPWPKDCVKNYEISIFFKGKWIKMNETKNNFQRFRKHRFKTVKASKLRLTVKSTSGARSAQVFEIRAYNE